MLPILSICHITNRFQYDFQTEMNFCHHFLLLFVSFQTFIFSWTHFVEHMRSYFAIIVQCEWEIEPLSSRKMTNRTRRHSSSSSSDLCATFYIRSITPVLACRWPAAFAPTLNKNPTCRPWLACSGACFIKQLPNKQVYFS